MGSKSQSASIAVDDERGHYVAFVAIDLEFGLPRAVYEYAQGRGGSVLGMGLTAAYAHRLVTLVDRAVACLETKAEHFIDFTVGRCWP